jgi:hypothetical protein
MRTSWLGSIWSHWYLGAGFPSASQVSKVLLYILAETVLEGPTDKIRGESKKILKMFFKKMHFRLKVIFEIRPQRALIKARLKQPQVSNGLRRELTVLSQLLLLTYFVCLWFSLVSFKLPFKKRQFSASKQKGIFVWQQGVLCQTTLEL